MNPGVRNQRVAFQEMVETPDGQGGATVAPVTRFSRWARVLPMSGRERLAAQQVEADRNYRVWVPNDSQVRTVTESWRLLWRDEPMAIRFKADAGPEEMEIMFEVETGVQG